VTARGISLGKRSRTTRGMAQGSCLCGEVAFELVRAAGREMECHCSRCRRAHSSVHASSIFVDARKFRWLRGEEQVSNGGLPQDCHFGSALCRSCGSALPRVVRSVGIVVVPSGALEGMSPRPQAYGCAPPPQVAEH
jgi:hypothetical protein